MLENCPLLGIHSKAFRHSRFLYSYHCSWGLLFWMFWTPWDRFPVNCIRFAWYFCFPAVFTRVELAHVGTLMLDKSLSSYVTMNEILLLLKFRTNSCWAERWNRSKIQIDFVVIRLKILVAKSRQQVLWWRVRLISIAVNIHVLNCVSQPNTGLSVIGDCRVMRARHLQRPLSGRCWNRIATIMRHYLESWSVKCNVINPCTSVLRRFRNWR